MSVTDYGDHGEPVISNPPTTVADMTAIAQYAAKIGNRIVVGNYADMTTNFVAKFGTNPWDGLECFNTDSGETTIYNASTGQWELAGAAGSTSTGGFFTPASGWTMGSGVQYTASALNGAVLQFYVSFFRNGSTITVPADGNVTNVTVGTVSLAPKFIYPAASGANGRIAHFTITSTGQVQLAAVTPGTNIANGDGFSFGGTYLT